MEQRINRNNHYHDNDHDDNDNDKNAAGKVKKELVNNIYKKIKKKNMNLNINMNSCSTKTLIRNLIGLFVIIYFPYHLWKMHYYMTTSSSLSLHNNNNNNNNNNNILGGDKRSKILYRIQSFASGEINQMQEELMKREETEKKKEKEKKKKKKIYNNVFFFYHFSKSGGTEMCRILKKSSQSPSFNIDFGDLKNYPRANCNPYKYCPQSMSCERQTCKTYLSSVRAIGTNIIKVERPLEEFPCSTTTTTTTTTKTKNDNDNNNDNDNSKINFIYFTILREPISRCISHLQYNLFSIEQANEWLSISTFNQLNCQNKKKRMGKWTQNTHHGIFFGSPMIDNFYIRMLLGSDIFYSPLGSINESHLQRAKEILTNFTLVIPLSSFESYGLSILGSKDYEFQWNTKERDFWVEKRKYQNIRSIKRSLINLWTNVMRKEEINLLKNRLIDRNKYDIELYQFVEQQLFPKQLKRYSKIPSFSSHNNHGNFRQDEDNFKTGKENVK